jgi:hypothetical protein
MLLNEKKKNRWEQEWDIEKNVFVACLQQLSWFSSVYTGKYQGSFFKYATTSSKPPTNHGHSTNVHLAPYNLCNTQPYLI